MSIDFLRLTLRFIRIPPCDICTFHFLVSQVGRQASLPEKSVEDREKRYMNQREKYCRLTERKKDALYHEWVRRNGFIGFTDWEVQVLRGDIKIDIWDVVNERKP